MVEDGVNAALQELSGHEFELFIAELWGEMGWITERTEQTRDKGIDIVATKETPYSQKVLIQTKRYGKGNKITSQDVRHYATLHRQEDADTVAIVTTSEVTDDAMELANDLNVKIVDGDDLLFLIERYEFESVLEEYTGSTIHTPTSSEESSSTNTQNLSQTPTEVEQSDNDQVKEDLKEIALDGYVEIDQRKEAIEALANFGEDSLPLLTDIANAVVEDEIRKKALEKSNEVAGDTSSGSGERQ